MLRTLRRIALLLVLSNSILAWAGFIRGQVRYQTGEFADHVVIRLRSDMVAFQTETFTDPQGKFNFDGLPLTTFRLTIEGQGFRPYETHIDISMSKMDYELITLRLDKEPEPKAVPPGGPQERVNAADAAAPENARKEFVKGQELLLRQNKVSDSIAHLEKAVKIYESYPQALALLGLAYMQTGAAKESHAALEKAVQLDPGSPQAHLTFGMLLNMEKDFVAAQRILERGVELQPEAPEGRYELAKAYWAQGQWQKAEPHAQKAVALQAGLAPAHILLGNIALKKQDTAGALKEFKEYLRLDPKGQFSVGVEQMVQKLEQSAKN